MAGPVDYAGFLLRDRETRAGRLTNVSLYALNTVFIGLYVASTYDLSPAVRSAVEAAELSLAVLFLGEYLVRVKSAEAPREEATDPYTLVDLVAVAPTFLSVGAGAGFLRSLHVLRVFRFLRLLVKERQVLGRSVDLRMVRRAELSITIFLIFFVASGFMYAAEAGANDDIANFGDAFYYTVIAVSTVGFGDIVPVTALGRWVTVAAVLVGFVLVPWQATRLRNLPTDPGTDCHRCGNEEVAVGDRYCRQCGALLDDAGDRPRGDRTDTGGRTGTGRGHDRAGGADRDPGRGPGRDAGPDPERDAERGSGRGPGADPGERNVRGGEADGPDPVPDGEGTPGGGTGPGDGPDGGPDPAPDREGSGPDDGGNRDGR